MKGNTPLYATVYGEGSGNLENIYNGKNVSGIIITGVDAIDKNTNERYTFDEKKQTIDDFIKNHSDANIIYTLSRHDDKTGELKVIGRVDAKTLSENTISNKQPSNENVRD